MKKRGCDLPEEVLGEIFSWLPPETLFRFKCVSKSWYALINLLLKDSEFVNKHLHNIDKKLLASTCLVFCSPSLAYFSSPNLLSLFKSATVFHDDNYSCFSVEDFSLPTLPSEPNLPFAFRRHCNGIICFAEFETVILCNPSIKEWRTLPKPRISHGNDFQVKGMGFGYDSKGNDYKIVRFGHEFSCPDGIVCCKARAEVYSMRRDSWKEIGIPSTFNCLEFHSSLILGKEVFCKGVCYWLVLSHNHNIISFDMFDEVFRSIQLPNNLLVVQKDNFTQVAVWNETIALFFYHSENFVTDSIEVWVMDDCSSGINGSCSWTKKLTITPPPEVAFPLAFLKNDEVLMQTIDVERFISYNLQTQMHTNITFVKGMYPNWDFSYVKSLLPVQGGN